jgi:Skp family chaperone for outer membrane proteins
LLPGFRFFVCFFVLSLTFSRGIVPALGAFRGFFEEERMVKSSDPAAPLAEGLDLTARREEFLETFFRKGAELTSELLEEVQSLRQRLDETREENLALRHQLASDDAIRDLLSKIEQLEQEKVSLRSWARDHAAYNFDYQARFAEVERELDSMANLYVASYQLHATLETREVLSVIEQLLMQFVGAASFVIFLTAERGGELVLEPVHAFQRDGAPDAAVRWGEGAIGEAAVTQVPCVGDPGGPREAGQPLACIPLILAGGTVGVIAIHALLEQKTGFVDIDFELFKLLALHSASAIVGAGLLARAGGVAAGLDAYQRLEDGGPEGWPNTPV